MAPHSQVRDVDSVEDYIFHAAAEIMPIGKVFLCAHQTADEHLQAGGVGNEGEVPSACGSACTFLELPTIQLFNKRLETHISPMSVLKLEDRRAS